MIDDSTEPPATGDVESRDVAMMELALAEACRALGHEDVPVGAVVVIDGAVVALGCNERELRQDPMAHAEILAIRAAAAEREPIALTRATLVVTLEPCVMCAGAIRAAGIETVVFGASDARAGAGGSRYDVLGDPRLGPPPRVRYGVLGAQCAEVLRAFFAARRGAARR
jgi:tRNA(adenine34) deaminase